MIGSTLNSLADVDEVQQPLRFKLLTALTAISFAILSTAFISVIGKNALSSVGNFESTDLERESDLLVTDGIGDSEIEERRTMHSTTI